MSHLAELVAAATTVAVILNAWILFFVNGLRSDINNLWTAFRELEKMVFLELSNGQLPPSAIRREQRARAPRYQEPEEAEGVE